MYCQICKEKIATLERKVDTGFGLVTVCVCKECATKIDSSSAKTYSRTLCESNIAYCKNCGSSLDSIIQTNYVGCEDCYNTFTFEIDKLVFDIHGRKTHVGKIPEKNLKEQLEKEELKNYSKKMRRALVEGDAQLATKTRDAFFNKMGGGI